MRLVKIIIELIALIIVFICIIVDVTVPSYMINLFTFIGAVYTTSLAIALLLIIIVLPFYIYEKIKEK